MNNLEEWQLYFIEMMEKAPFGKYDLEFDLSNPAIQAHLTIEQYLDYYCYNEKVGKFWTIISMLCKPKVIVELGTAFGNRTDLIGRLNPDAKLYSVDILNPLPLNNMRVPTGYLARLNKTPFTFIHGRSWETQIEEKVNLCFVDADHREDTVYKDSLWVWENRDENDWYIIWDDYPLPTVERAVNRFCKEKKLTLGSIGGYKYVGSKSIPYKEKKRCQT
jgi:hypothetical protein